VELVAPDQMLDGCSTIDAACAAGQRHGWASYKSIIMLQYVRTLAYLTFRRPDVDLCSYLT
jgi:hypothetical protein